MSLYSPVPFDHTYILYDPNDIVSTACVQLSLLPVYIMVFYTSWFLITRESEPVIVVGGHLTSEILNKIVKKIFKQPRPAFHRNFGLASSSLLYGMPSAHSQFMGFFAAYYVLIALFKVPLSRRERISVIVILPCLALGVAFSRVYLMYHTVEQVAIGVALGTTFGSFYFVVTSILREVGFVDWAIQWPIVRLFYIKDLYYHCYQSYAEEHRDYMAKRKRLA